MRVYVVFKWNTGDQEIDKIFADRSDAESYVAKRYKGKPYKSLPFDIAEHKVVMPKQD